MPFVSFSFITYSYDFSSPITSYVCYKLALQASVRPIATMSEKGPSALWMGDCTFEQPYARRSLSDSLMSISDLSLPQNRLIFADFRRFRLPVAQRSITQSDYHFTPQTASRNRNGTAGGGASGGLNPLWPRSRLLVHAVGKGTGPQLDHCAREALSNWTRRACPFTSSSRLCPDRARGCYRATRISPESRALFARRVVDEVKGSSCSLSPSHTTRPAASASKVRGAFLPRNLLRVAGIQGVVCGEKPQRGERGRQGGRVAVVAWLALSADAAAFRSEASHTQGPVSDVRKGASGASSSLLHTTEQVTRGVLNTMDLLPSRSSVGGVQ